MSEYSKSIRPWTGYRWHCDEIYLRIRGQQRWLFAVMDSFSRIILAYGISHTKMNFDRMHSGPQTRDPDGSSTLCGNCFHGNLFLHLFRGFEYAPVWIPDQFLNGDAWKDSLLVAGARH